MIKNFIIGLGKFCTYIFGSPGFKGEISLSIAVSENTLEENSLTNVSRKDSLENSVNYTVVWKEAFGVPIQ